MNGIGENKLIAFLAGLVSLTAVAWLKPDALPVVSTSVIALFGLLLNKRKEEKEGGDQ